VPLVCAPRAGKPKLLLLLLVLPAARGGAAVLLLRGALLCLIENAAHPLRGCRQGNSKTCVL